MNRELHRGLPHRYRAPREHGGILAVPPLTEVGTLLDANRHALAHTKIALLDRPLAELRELASRTLLDAARNYLLQAGEPVPDITHPESLLLAGHQPELFHPGVWVKNFALNSLARKHRATPVNLLVDSDTVKSTALKVPDWSADPAAVHRSAVAFDIWNGEVPYEERVVLDERLFADFPDRVAEHTRSWPFAPLLPAFWRAVLEQARRTPLLGERFVAARRDFERRWGCHNLEVPLHAVCRTEGFAWFACHLLAEGQRFHAVYNDCVRAYRREHGIRSRSHPVPDLLEDAGWFETPFFAWRTGAARRGRLFARLSGRGVTLRIDAEPGPTIPAGRDGVAAWLDLERQGLKVRSRALTTTMYARLLLADLFIHGIGGGKYDELTDAILGRFFDVQPPAFLVLSATLRLPFPALPSTETDCTRLARQLRDVQWNPQRHLNGMSLTPAIRELAAEKQRWIEREPTDAQGHRDRFLTLRLLTGKLNDLLSEQEREMHQRLERCRQEARANTILQNREYAFCWYPEEGLRGFNQQFLK